MKAKTLQPKHDAEKACPCCTAGGDPFKPAPLLVLKLADMATKSKSKDPEIQAWLASLRAMGYMR